MNTNMRREIRNFPADMISRVIANFNVRVAAVIQQRWAWIERKIDYWKLTAWKIFDFCTIRRDEMFIIMEKFGENYLNCIKHELESKLGRFFMDHPGHYKKSHI